MKRPLVPILCCFISGILVEHYWSLAKHIDERTFQSDSYFTLVVFYGMLVGIWYGLYRFNASRLSMLVLLFLAVVTGVTRYTIALHLPVDHISHFIKDEGDESRPCTIEGFLYKPPEYVWKKRYLYVETTWLEQGDRRYRVRGKVRITVGGSSGSLAGTKTFSYGDTIRARLRLRIPKNYDDSEDFNYREFLRRRGIYLLGYLRYDRYIIKLPERQGNPLLAGIYVLRTRIIHFLDQYVAREQAGTHQASEAIQVIKAMTLGTSRELSLGVKEKFRHAGMYHFLVVSGIHIGILVGVFHQVLQVFRIPLRYRSIVFTTVLLVYAGLSGFHFPVLRASIMALALYFSITCNRIPDPLYTLAFSGGVILFLCPTALFEVSFQLTIAATASILLFVRFLQRFRFWEQLSKWHALIRLPLITVLITFGAMIGISPLIAFYFQQLYPYSLLSNPLALPFISLLLPLSLVSDFLSLFLPWKLVYPLLSVTVALAKCVIFLTSVFPKIDIMPPRPSPFMLIIYYIALYLGLSYCKELLTRVGYFGGEGGRGEISPE